MSHQAIAGPATPARELRALPSPNQNTAFSRLDLLAALAGVALLGLLAAPLAASVKPRGERIACLNNLRQLGQGWNAWAADHGDRYPWRVPYLQGGMSGHPLASQSWVQFSAISNELRSPKAFVCPSDKPAVVASDFSDNFKGGLGHANFRNSAVSYVIGLDVFSGDATQCLSGDPHFRFDARSDCSVGVRNTAAIMTRPMVNPSVGWTNTLHDTSGNLLFADGRVEELSNAGFRATVGRTDDIGVAHFLTPR